MAIQKHKKSLKNYSKGQFQRQVRLRWKQAREPETSTIHFHVYQNQHE